MKTFILVADGSRASLYSRTSEQPQIRLMEAWDNQGGRTPDHHSESDDLGSSRPGSSMTPHTDPKRHSQQVFAKKLSTVLNERVSGYDQLVVAAAPKFLGDLRQDFGDAVSQKIVAELDKDLTHLSIYELAPHFEEVLAT